MTESSDLSDKKQRRGEANFVFSMVTAFFTHFLLGVLPMYIFMILEMNVMSLYVNRFFAFITNFVLVPGPM